MRGALALLAALLFWSDSTAARFVFQQSASLRIVVIEGDNAVNIIQQKTAVAPVVEVRDRNDLPVGGVPVSFTVNGAGASFAGGARTLTVTTNAAGRAAATALNPLSAGSVQINVTAALQGQVATVTITQTNVLTAAAAAGASAEGAGAVSSATGGTTGTSAGAAAGGGAAGAGGGLSATTLALVGAAAAGGAVAATQAGGQEEDGGESGAPAPVNRVFMGPLSAESVLPFISNATGLVTCTRTTQNTGNLRMDLTIRPDGTIVGPAVAGISWVVTALVPRTPQITCGGPQVGERGSESFAAQVEGTAAALSFAFQRSTQFQDTPTSTGTTTDSWTFTGTLNNDVVTGTLRLDSRIESASSTGSNTVTYNVTLRP